MTRFYLSSKNKQAATKEWDGDIGTDEGSFFLVQLPAMFSYRIYYSFVSYFQQKRVMNYVSLNLFVCVCTVKNLLPVPIKQSPVIFKSQFKIVKSQ